jgi:hypothetical protein
MKQNKYLSHDFDHEVISLLEQSLKREDDPLVRYLGRRELRNPSLEARESVLSACRFEGLLITYTSDIIPERTGIDFLTNQPKYEERETNIIMGESFKI